MKIFEIDKIKNKKEKTEKIYEYIEAIKDSLADVIGEYENTGNDDQADALTDALDALEDACESIYEALED